MIVKGIIKSIDYTGNTCTVRIPVFESAANENEVVVPATLSTLPGIYNGYKEEDVVFIAFENNDYDMPIVIGKLYLGVENEKNDPRGAIVCNNITAAQPISIPISSQLTLDNDPQHSPIIGVDKGIDSYKSIADLAKNLQKQDEKLGSLSVKVIDDGENLGAEIAKKVSITDEATKQRGLGWNLNTEKWEIYAKDTVGDTNNLAKLPIMTIDRTGMVISGNLVLTGYPQTTEIKYTNSTDKNTPPTGDDVKWQDNTNDLYTDEHYIWKRTREVFYAYNAETDKWELTKYGDAHYECITGAKGDSGYNTVTVMLYKRSKTSISGKQIDIDLYYKFSDQKLYINDTCTTDYTLPEGWYYTISGTGDSSNGDLYCIAAIAHSNTDSDSISHSEWIGPTLYVKNGEPTVTLSIENDLDSIPCDYYGNPSYSKKEWETKTSHTIKVLEGQVQQQFSVIADSSDKQIPSTGYAVVYKPDDSITYVVDTTDKTLFTAHITNLTVDSANVLYTLYKNGIAIDEARFTATKLKAGAPGDPAVDYDILFSSSTIKVSKTGDKTPRTINVNFKKTVGQAEPVDFSGTYKVFIDNGTEPISQGTASSIILATSGAISPQIEVSSAKSSVIVELYTADGNTKLESETIDVIADGTDGTSVANLVLYKRAASTPDNPGNDGTWTYNATDGSLTCDNKETKWKTSIPSETEPCYESHAAVLITGLGTITVTTWSEPAKFVENGVKGDPGVGIASLKTYYLMQDPISTKPNKPDPNKEVGSDSKWKETPDVYIDGYVYWLTTQTIYSDGRISYSDPVKDNGLDGVYEIAQGKSKNYYGDVDPAGSETAKAKMRKGDGWFDTAYHKIAKPTTSTGYLQKYIKEQNTEKYILITSQNITEYISGSDPANWPDAYSGPTLYQWSANGKDGQWEDVGGELIANKVTANYINALDITAKKITVLDKSNNDKPLFEADGINGTGKVKIADFDVNYESLKSFSETNGYELNIRSAGEIEKNKEITIDDTYMTWEDILVPSSIAQQAQQIRPQLNWDTMEKWPKNGRYDPKDGVDIKDASITDNYTLLHLDTPAWDTTSDIKNDIWLAPQGYISFLKISIKQDILDFNAWIGIISSSSKNELNNSDYLSSQDTIRLFSSTTNFETWEALKTELDKFKSGSASQLSELGYCRPAIGDETSKMPMPGVLTDNLVKFSWGKLSAKTYLYCVVENNYQRDFIVSNSSESGQDKVIEYEDAYGNIHTIIVPAGADATLVPGYLQAFLILDKTFTKYGAAISAGYNGEDFILTGDGKLITSNILVTGGSITADSGNIGPLEISAGEINTAGLMINKSSTHIKNGASLKILGVSGNTTKPIAKLSKNGFIISAQGMQAENNKYFNYKIGEVSGPNDTPNTPGLLWKQRDVEYSTVYVRAKLDSMNKKIIFTLYSDSARTKQYDTKQLPSNKTLDVMVYLKYIKKIIRKRKISRDITIEVDGSAVKTNFIPLPTQLMTTVSPIQFKFKNGDASIQEVSFANISVFDKIYGISNTRGGAPQVESEPLEFTISAPTSINALDPNLYITSSILPASTFEKDGSVTKETKNEYDLGSSTYPWNNVYSKYFYGVSDRREKTDITPLSEQNNLDEFYSKLKPVSFSFKSSNDTLHFGLIAQDVDEASACLPTDKPLAIVDKSDPNCLSIDYQELIAVNILKIQQLSKKIDSLEAEIKCLKGED